MRRMKRVGAVAAALVVAGLSSGCSTTSAQASRTTPVSTLATTTSSSKAGPTSATKSMPPPPPIASPTWFSGSGDAIVPITKPAGSTAVIATITGNQYGKHFDVRALDGYQTQLVATTAPYHGSTLLDPLGTTTTQLRVHAIGPWTITLSDARSAPIFTAGYRGSGDVVLLDESRGRTATISVGGSGPFRISMYGNGRAYRPIIETGPWSGTVAWPTGVGLVAVQATGPWTISFSEF